MNATRRSSRCQGTSGSPDPNTRVVACGRRWQLCRNSGGAAERNPAATATAACRCPGGREIRLVGSWRGRKSAAPSRSRSGMTPGSQNGGAGSGRSVLLSHRNPGRRGRPRRASRASRCGSLWHATLDLYAESGRGRRITGPVVHPCGVKRPGLWGNGPLPDTPRPMPVVAAPTPAIRRFLAEAADRE